MASLSRAKQRAQACRQRIGTQTSGMLTRVMAYLWEAHDIEAHPVNAAFLDGGRAEVSPAEGCLFLRRAIRRRASAKNCWSCCTSWGIWSCTTAYRATATTPDPVLGSIYLNDGAASLARYHPSLRRGGGSQCLRHRIFVPQR